MDSNSTLPVGATLRSAQHEYRIEQVLGQGSFGITYLATTEVELQGQVSGALGGFAARGKSQIQVCIKEFFMRDMNTRTAEGSVSETSAGTLVQNYRIKFSKEAEKLAQLDHPNIVKVAEVFDDNGTTYYAMQYIDGESLDDYITRLGGLTEDETLRITREIGNGLHYMHNKHLLHLDLKPKNVMLDRDGHVHLIDFGLSKHYDANGEPETSTSIGGGTPGYAPLEQLSGSSGRGFAPTLDVYALGATMWKMLTAKTPPVASDVLANGLPVQKLKSRGVSSKTITVIQQAMAPVPKQRFQTIQDMMGAIGGRRAASVPPAIPLYGSTNGYQAEDEVTQLHQGSTSSNDYTIKDKDNGKINIQGSNSGGNEIENLSLWEYFLKCLRKTFDYKGRARRKEYWGFMLIYALIYAAAYCCCELAPKSEYETVSLMSLFGMFLFFICLLLTLPHLAVTSRRLHDIDHSFWNILICLIPLLGPLYLIGMLCLDGLDGPNKYGPDPKGR